MSNPESRDLFEFETTPSPARLLAVFESWAATAPGKSARSLNDESVSVYRDMWTSLVKWAVGLGVDVASITATELEAYLLTRGSKDGASELQDRYAWRLLRLVERVLLHGGHDSCAAPNRAVSEILERRPDIKHSNASDKDPLPEFLDAADARSLVAHLAGFAETRNAIGTWQGLRNRCAVALHLGAGLTPAEVRALSVPDIRGLGRGTRKVRVPAHGTVLEHEAPIADWAWRVVEAWVELRGKLAVPGTVLLPATRSGKPWGKTTHYDAVLMVLEAVGLPGAGGAYRLRHTFALRQLKRGRSQAELAAWMGVEAAALDRHRRVVAGPVDVA